LVTSAAWLLASYLLYHGTIGLGLHRRNVELRLDGLEDLVEHRGERLAGTMPGRISEWKDELANRVRRLRVGLVVASVVLGVVGVAGGVATSRDHEGAPESGVREADSRSVLPSPAVSALPSKSGRRK
jgi:hypothetical protein